MGCNGLTSKEVEERVKKGQVNKVREKVSRSYTDIIIKNVFTPFNIMIFAVGVILLLLEEYSNAVSATIFILLNIVVATFQEVRAKRKLDRIALSLRPTVTVIRDGKKMSIDQSEIVIDDIILINPGDQVLVDGKLIEGQHLEMDESPLTGESSTVRKHDGDEIFSGTYCVTGSGYFVTTAFGENTYLYKMTASARKYKNKFTPLQLETSSVIKVHIATCFIFLIIMVILVALKGLENIMGLKATLSNAVIVFDIVPMALPLFVTIGYMVAAVRMANKGVLLQRTNAVESLSNIDTICMDKTGTITTNKLLFKEYTKYDDTADEIVRMYLGTTGGRNRTVEALTDEFGTSDAELIDEIRFSSERKYSAVKIKKDGKTFTVYLGAFTSLGKYLDVDVSDKVNEYTGKGLRAVVMGVGKDVTFFEDGQFNIPDLKTTAVFGISDELRTNCRETLDVFYKNNIDVKIVSGDDPATISSLFDLADIPGDRNIISGDELENLKGEKRRKAILESNIFGRMKPDQKEMVIEALKNEKRYVAMVGDGVNDVKSLKMAHVGIALQSGASAAKGSSEIVLANDDFAAIPKTFVEGKRTLAGMRDALKIFLTKNVIIAFLVFFIMIVMSLIMNELLTPMLPTQQMVYAFLAVTILSFLVVVWAKPDEKSSSVMPKVMNYIIPTALTASIFAVILYIIVYVMAFHGQIDTSMLDLEFIKKYGFPAYENTEAMIEYYGSLEEALKCRGAEIFARSALVMFVIVEGIVQTLMIVPRWKFLSLDGHVNKDNRPVILVVILLALTALVYALSYAGILKGLFPVAPLNLECTLFILGMVVLWFMVNLILLRKGKLNFITRRFERGYHEMLARTYASSEKEDHEDIDSIEKLKSKLK